MAIGDIAEKIAGISTRLDNIRADVEAIKAQLPQEGGATADEVAQIRSAIDAALAKAVALDDENTPPAA